MAAVLQGEAQLAVLAGELVCPDTQPLMTFLCAGNGQLARNCPLVSSTAAAV